jgi:hypothetical protein
MDAGVTVECGTRDGLLCALVEELMRACNTIARLDDDAYRQPVHGSSIGAQFRHDLDFVTNLLRGIEIGRIDHSARERDMFVETDRKYAIGRFRKLIAKIRVLDSRVLGKSILIRSELDTSLWLPSSVGREVEFTHSHTVHHHALIAEKLAALGIAAPQALGVAPSTLKYWAAQAA